MHAEFNGQINRVAETHFYLRPVLIKALKGQLLTDDARKCIGKDLGNYAELWEATFSDRFFDMATMIRLGSVIEGCLKWYYMSKKGHTNIPQLEADPAYKPNIFQRVQSGQSKSAITLYSQQLGIDLTTNLHLRPMQEAMMHRHLYAHNPGLVDADYIKKIKRITGQDLTAMPQIAQSFPNDDTYWFEPLRKLPHFIEEARSFFRAFP